MKKDTKQSNDSEARFQITVTIRARWVGDTIAFFDKKTEAFDIHQVKDVPREKNVPRGSQKEAIKEIINKEGAMKKRDLYARLNAIGFKNPYQMIKELTSKGQLKMTRSGVIALGKVEF